MIWALRSRQSEQILARSNYARLLSNWITPLSKLLQYVPQFGGGGGGSRFFSV